MKYVLAIDQGTTSTRAILFDEAMHPAASAQQEFEQHFPDDGWVEHNPEDIWRSTIDVCKKVLKQNEVSASEIAGIGITNQKPNSVETTRSRSSV